MPDTLPTPEEIRRPLVALLYLFGGEAPAQRTYGPLADHFGLSDEARKRLRREVFPNHAKAGNELAWSYLVYKGTHGSQHRGWIVKASSTPRGVWRLTARGRGIAETFLRRNGDFHELAHDTNVETEGLPAPLRDLVSMYRIQRDSRVALEVKRAENYVCQLCGAPGIPLPGGALYAEAHHIIPLSYGGPDTSVNVICVCPSCHVQVDFAARAIPPEMVRRSSHDLDPTSIRHHNARFKVSMEGAS